MIPHSTKLDGNARKSLSVATPDGGYENVASTDLKGRAKPDTESKVYK